jgi:NAD-dependent DNA ligase
MPLNRSLQNCSFNPLPVKKRLTDAGKREIREVCIHFVTSGSGPVSHLMRDARRFVQESGLAEALIRTIAEEYLMQSLANESIRNEIVGIFVLEQFSGSVYEELRKRQKEDDKCRLMHPLTIFQARNGIELRLPFKPHPLRSLALFSVTGVTLSGDLTPDERSDLKQQILLMGGAVHQTVSQKRTSVVVARKMTDSRCLIARDMHPAIPIVTPEWVRHCYTETLKDHVICGRKIYDKFTLSAFAGCALSPAQVMNFPHLLLFYVLLT